MMKTYSNLGLYNFPENIGSEDWFRTFLAHIKHMEEFIERHPTNYNNTNYGLEIKNRASDLIQWGEQNREIFNKIKDE